MDTSRRAAIVQEMAVEAWWQRYYAEGGTMARAEFDEYVRSGMSIRKSGKRRAGRL